MTTTMMGQVVQRGQRDGRDAAVMHRPDHDDDCDCWPAPLSGEWAGESMPEIYHDLTGRDYQSDWDRAVKYPLRATTPDDVLDTYEDAYLTAYVDALNQ